MAHIEDEFDLNKFKLAWAKLIAIAWDDKDFEQQLYKEDPAGIRAKFAMFLNFALPDDLNLKIVKLDASQEGWDAKNQRWNLTSSASVQLGLPPRPKDTQQAVALAEYQSLAQQYPLSCCC
jgi:ribosomally synthesized peptide (two-chain TOMM family)